VTAVGGLGLTAATGAAGEVALAHEPGHAPTSDVLALVTELLAHARAAVGAAAALVDEGNFGRELPVVLGAWAFRTRLPGVVPAEGEIESLA
jgi:hypothetical protein